MDKLYLSAPGILCALGNDKEQVAEGLFAGDRSGLVQRDDLLMTGPAIVAAVQGELPALPEALGAFDCRNSRILAAALAQIRPDIEAARARHGAGRIAVVLGSSTAGIDEGEKALARYLADASLPQNYDYTKQTLGSVAEFAGRYLELEGPCYTISTACSSAGKAFASGARLIRAGLADAVVVGGVDSLCRLTLNGFNALESVSAGPCSPFSEGRSGITIGEGAGVFLLSREPGRVALTGFGEASDGYHISAPEPEGKGAWAAMAAALAMAGLSVGDIDYINLHGTGTPKNDAMEAALVSSRFPHGPRASSSKGQVGHCLGAAGAIEAALCYLALTDGQGRLPPHCMGGHWDPALPALNLADGQPGQPIRRAMSNSYAFGGSNVSLILEAQ
ncbi:beta-ketoacyl-[acyl-carrier-protein] synthase family protein [Gallaecimonas sp. GXIMD4217]|uniref:beta-ketoacyl-[acyl-carrier-protein] synthase family protein n=1 Tax=Gallaecimonas sp. GXIMD4217 TaxID=3131927 RepID=UPI00311ACEF5